MPKLIKTFIIDAFTQTAFAGNPAGVCLLEAELPEPQMQAIAAELNLSETAFLVQDTQKEQTFSIRFFTPTVEIAFCGHATLASAKLVLSTFGWQQVCFLTAHGLELQAAAGQKEAIVLQFPLYHPQPHQPLPNLASALGLDTVPNLYLAHELQMLIVQVADKETLLGLQPKFDQLLLAAPHVRGLAVTAQSTDMEYDFYSRCFWPWMGINEDPVTGSAHSALASLWSKRLQKTELNAFQCSRRGGSMRLRLTGPTTLEVTAHARLVLEGVLQVD